MLGILTTHPIQYQVPLWRELTRRALPLEVLYLSTQGADAVLDKGFGRQFAWDLDLLTGYRYRVVETRPSPPDISRFRGARLVSPRRLLATGQYTVLLVHGWVPQAYWQAVVWAHRLRIPVMLRAETNDLRRRGPWTEILRRPLLRSLFRRVTMFLSVGIANRRFYRKYGVPESKLGSSPYCVDTERFGAAAAELRPQRNLLREMWRVPVESTCYLFCGKLIAKKRVEDLVEAFARLLGRGDGARLHLLITGDGALRRPLEERAVKLNRAFGGECVTFTGFLNQSEMPKAYVVADCLVLPSDAEETWGLVVNEGMASGLPAIVSDQVGCSLDLVKPGRTGEIFPMADVESLAAAMARWSDSARCEAARVAVQAKAGDYSIARAAEGIAQGYYVATIRGSRARQRSVAVGSEDLDG